MRWWTSYRSGRRPFEWCDRPNRQSETGERVAGRSERRLSRQRNRCRRVRSEMTARSTEPRHDTASWATRSGWRGDPNVAALDNVASRRSSGEASRTNGAPCPAISESEADAPMSRPASTSASVADAHAPLIRPVGSGARSRRLRRRYFAPTISPAASRNGTITTANANDPRSTQESAVDSAPSDVVAASSSGVAVSLSDSGGGAIGGWGAAGVWTWGSGGGGAPSAASSGGTGS